MAFTPDAASPKYVQDRKILESQATEFLESHPGFLDPAPDQEECNG